MRNERRNQTALGRKRRREFNRSVDKIRALGMPDWAVEYFRRAARVAGLPPHMVVCHVAVVAAGRQLQATIAQEQQMAGPAASDDSPGMPSKGMPSYGEVRTLRRRVTSLWREIERHGSPLDAAVSEGNAHAASQPKELSPSKLAEKLTLLSTHAGDSEPSAGRSRRRKASPKGH
jgi:hypothetical protein